MNFQKGQGWGLKPIIPGTWEVEIRFETGLSIGQDLTSKITTAKRTRGATQVVEQLPSMCEALNSIPSNASPKKGVSVVKHSEVKRVGA
jgi:hypothetical protein